jgi:hypothetical protein
MPLSRYNGKKPQICLKLSGDKHYLPLISISLFSLFFLQSLCEYSALQTILSEGTIKKKLKLSELAKETKDTVKQINMANSYSWLSTDLCGYFSIS